MAEHNLQQTANVSGTAGTGSKWPRRDARRRRQRRPLPAAISRIIKGRDAGRFVCAGHLLLADFYKGTRKWICNHAEYNAAFMGAGIGKLRVIYGDAEMGRR